MIDTLCLIVAIPALLCLSLAFVSWLVATVWAAIKEPTIASDEVRTTAKKKLAETVRQTRNVTVVIAVVNVLTAIYIGFFDPPDGSVESWHSRAGAVSVAHERSVIAQRIAFLFALINIIVVPPVLIWLASASAFWLVIARRGTIAERRSNNPPERDREGTG